MMLFLIGKCCLMTNKSKTYNLLYIKRRSRLSGLNLYSYQIEERCGELIKRSEKGRSTFLLSNTHKQIQNE
jgi:hypothetical protein